MCLFQNAGDPSWFDSRRLQNKLTYPYTYDSFFIYRKCTQGNYSTEGNGGNCQSGDCHSGERWMSRSFVHGGKWDSNEGIDNIASVPVNNMYLLHVIKWQEIRLQALWKSKTFDKVCLKFQLPPCTKGMLIHLSLLW